jgi:hypothetical protein
MNKFIKLAAIVLAIAVVAMGLHYGERSRLLKGIAVKSADLDSLLAKKEHDDSQELMTAAAAYLNETAFALTKKGLFFGSYFSNRDKNTIFANATDRLLRLKETLLADPGLTGSELPDIALLVDRFYEKTGTAAYFNKDKALIDLLGLWTASGERGRIYFSEDEKDEHQGLMLIRRQQEDAEKYRLEMNARNENKPREPDIPGGEDVLKQKQRQVTRVTRLEIPFEKLDQYRDQEINVQLKNHRQISGRLAEVKSSELSLGFEVEGNFLRKIITREEIDKIEKVTVEKVLEMFDPSKERESTLSADFKDLDFKPYPKEKDYVAFVTLENKLIFVSIDGGALTCHSQTNQEGYKPQATRLKENWLNDVKIRYIAYEHSNGNNINVLHAVTLWDIAWYRPLTNSSSTAMNSRNIMDKGLEKYFNFVFEIRLVKEMADGTPPIIIFHKDLVLNPRNVRLMFLSSNIERAIYDYGNPKFGKGAMPWEYEIKSR